MGFMDLWITTLSLKTLLENKFKKYCLSKTILEKILFLEQVG